MRQAKLSSLPAYCQYHGDSTIAVFLIGCRYKMVVVPLDGYDVLAHDGNIVFFGLLSHLQHEVEPVYLRESRVVFDKSARRCLATKQRAEYHGLHLVACRIEGGGVRRGPCPTISTSYIVSSVVI